MARVQVDEVLPVLRTALPEDTIFRPIFVDTPGDRDKITSLSSAAVPEDYFTRDLDEALRRGDIDLAVHSAKDLPRPVPPDLCVAALLPAKDIRDALVLRSDWPAGTPPRVVGTSSPRRTDGVRARYPDAEGRDIRGDVPDRLEQLDRGHYDAVIVAACALERLGLAHRIAEYLPVDPVPQQGRLALVCRAADQALIDHLRTLDVRRRAGLVALVGCPADPAMIPDRIRLYIDQGDIILHDRLVPEAAIQRAGTRAVCVGKTGGGHSIPQSEINRRMLMEAEQGRLVVRLQGGDPGIFGHLGEELEFLHAWNIRVDVVPALSAAQVAAARARAALTHRHGGRHVAFVTGHHSQSPPPPPLPGPSAGNLAVYMGVQHRKELRDRLLQAGWAPDTPVLIGERLGYPDEQTYPCRLDELPDLPVQTPAVLLVGIETAGEGPVTLFTGTHPEHFLKHGPLLHWPMITLEPLPLETRAATLAHRLPTVDGILFPSRVAVTCFLEALLHLGDTRQLAGKYLLAVGPSTADTLAQYGLRADLAAHALQGVRDLAARIPKALQGSYLYPCSDAAPTAQRTAFLAKFGITLLPEVFYQNQPAPPRHLPKQPFHRVLFTSSSTVQTYFKQYPDEHHANRTWLAVGPSTLETLQSFHLPAELLPS